MPFSPINARRHGDGVTAARSISARACASRSRQIAAEELGDRRRQDQICRGRHRAHARSGPHVRLDRHPARRHADPAGGGDRAQGADRTRRASGSTCRPTISSSRTARCGRRPAAPASTSPICSAASSFDLKLDPKAPLKNPATYTMVGKPLPRPDVPAKCTGSHTYMQDFTRAGHAACPRDPAAGDRRQARRRSTKPRSRICPAPRSCGSRISSRVVADDEWTAVRAAARAEGAMERVDRACRRRTSCRRRCAPVPFTRRDAGQRKGERRPRHAGGAKTLKATYYWPMQSHASIGPSCAVADVRADAARRSGPPRRAPIGNRTTFARFLGLPRRKSAADLSRRLRLLRHERP